MRKKVVLFQIIALSVFAIPLQAQNSDYERYMGEAGGNSLLYRGRIDNKPNFQADGTYFAYDKKFTKGDIFYNGKNYKDVLINLNAEDDELNVKKDETKLAITLEKSLVKSFVLDGRHFVNIRNSGSKVIPDGYYEVIYDGKSRLLKKITKVYKEELIVSSASQGNIIRKYDSNVKYFIEKDSNYYPVKGSKSFVSCFKESKKSIKKVFSRPSVAEQNNKDLLYQRVMSQGCNQ